MSPYHDVGLVAEGSVILALDDQQRPVEEEDVAGRFSAVHSERSFRHQLAVGGQIFTRPSVQQTLHFLHPDGVLVLPLHIVDMMSNALDVDNNKTKWNQTDRTSGNMTQSAYGHCGKGDDNVRIAGRRSGPFRAMFDNVLQEQVILEDPLDGFEEVRAQRERVLEGRLTLAARPAGSLVPHQLRQHRHFPGGWSTKMLLSLLI